ncbi:AbrB/MazE/SpoVT family DNA-binding domain-containing protein [Halolamina salifodinae]|uniref:Bifunctional DNA-binding transcriptional regulator/antitoxin component of YhaV-PrlF toxin-antitoxin module n=1 Tax=Halolamina salifodinae TaxID=1202767 RepID=A0A8T4GXD1_9EURY|nr:AbrB/MazE/SpoVT family DNA-binding domain-containing protein [Halolamina salifodinae]MBP1986812.1 bifunctional DNA-binding transcriptional regulator/antitoxin component of YhaV-PrlF toxin-antitoxin module [Halolamina salifodinae]
MSSGSENQNRIEAKSTVNDSYGTTIPSEIRKALGEKIEPGDTVRWVVSDGELSLEIVHERYGAFEDAAPFDGPEWDGEEVAEGTWIQ